MQLPQRFNRWLTETQVRRSRINEPLTKKNVAAVESYARAPALLSRSRRRNRNSKANSSIGGCSGPSVKQVSKAHSACGSRNRKSDAPVINILTDAAAVAAGGGAQAQNTHALLAEAGHSLPLDGDIK